MITLKRLGFGKFQKSLEKGLTNMSESIINFVGYKKMCKDKIMIVRGDSQFLKDAMDVQAYTFVCLSFRGEGKHSRSGLSFSPISISNSKRGAE